MQRKMDPKERTRQDKTAQGTKNLGTRETTVFVLCLVTERSQQKLEGACRVGPDESLGFDLTLTYSYSFDMDRCHTKKGLESL